MTFKEFYYQEYLARHTAPICRVFHFIGPPAALVLLGVVVWLQNWWLLLLLPVPPYLLAWLGHMLVPNQPTFFEHPLLSFLGYWKLFGSMLTGGLRAKAR